MSHSIWIADDDTSLRWVIRKALTQDDRELREFGDADSLVKALGQETPDLVISDVRMPGSDGMELLAKLAQAHPDIPVILITAYANLDTSVSAHAAGAFDYLPKPFDIDQLRDSVERALETRPLTANQEDTEAAGGFVGRSPALQKVFQIIGRLSGSELNVLIRGETGTGKELVAKALHRHSRRSQGPFVAINSAAVPAELLESELFGHEKGAFTGAQNQRIGRFEQAHGGTLFLDEIGDMPLALQARLLRVLAEGEFYRVGGTRALRADVRIVSATNQDLEAMVEQGEFRRDLLHRLEVVGLTLPPLRERGDDVIELAEHFLAQAAEQQQVRQRHLSEAAKQALRKQRFPGNVRELENLCQRITAIGVGETISADEIPISNAGDTTPEKDWLRVLDQWALEQLREHGELPLDQARQALEARLINHALNHTGDHRQQAAQILGIGRNTLTRKLSEREPS
jgi:two-component system nitrogen regulation response regulator GlnG